MNLGVVDPSTTDDHRLWSDERSNFLRDASQAIANEFFNRIGRKRTIAQRWLQLLFMPANAALQTRTVRNCCLELVRVPQRPGPGVLVAAGIDVAQFDLVALVEAIAWPGNELPNALSGCAINRIDVP